MAAACRGARAGRGRGSYSWDASAGALYDAYRDAVERRRASTTMTGETLTIGIDARELLGETTGVGRYLGELLRRWVVDRRGERANSCLYTPEPLPFVKTLPADAPLRQVVVGSGTGTWWEQTHLRRAVRAESSRRLLRAAPTRRRSRSAYRWPSPFTTCRSPRIPSGSRPAKARVAGC